MRILPTLLLLTSTGALDRFNYDRTQGNNYGPKDWGRVDCHDVATCVSIRMMMDSGKGIDRNIVPSTHIAHNPSEYSLDGQPTGTNSIRSYPTMARKICAVIAAVRVRVINGINNLQSI